jgi:hypothetical protein
VRLLLRSPLDPMRRHINGRSARSLRSTSMGSTKELKKHGAKWSKVLSTVFHYLLTFSQGIVWCFFEDWPCDATLHFVCL